MVVEEGRQPAYVAVPRRFEELAIHREQVDMFLERPPARKAVVLPSALRKAPSGFEPL
jgi:hypothetical protein